VSRIIRLPPDWAPVDWAPVDQDSLFAQSALSDLSETEFSPAVGLFQPIMLPPGPAAVAITSGAPPTPFDLTFKGVNYSADIYQSFTTVPNSLPTVVATGGNAVALTTNFGIDAVDNTVYQNDVAGGFTESNADIATAVQNAGSLGLSVMVRPLIDFLPKNYADDPNPLNGSTYYNDEFRNNYNPGAAGSAGADAFFASYQTMIVAQAKLAQANGAGLFCIGAELDQITGPAYESYWTTIIKAIRAVFTGKLTYSALWDDNQSYWQYQGTGLVAGTGDITTQVSFWKQLDYIGIDEYAPISDLAKPTVSQLVAGWTEAPTDALTSTVTGGQSLISYYEGISATLGMPLIFTELGYGNSSDAAISPATPGYGQDGSADGATADPTLQSNLYQAFFQAWQQDGNGSLVGAYLWNWEPDGTNASSVDTFTVQGLPAQQAVKAGFTACYAAGTRILTTSGEVAVEALRVGQRVRTAAGEAKPISWIGHRSIDGEVWPVRVQAHAFGPGRPHRDLWLSPDHAVLVDGDGEGAAPAVLIPIRYLVNGATVCQERRDQVTYFHVELAMHDVLLAEGLPAESYLDTGNRAAFANGDRTPVAA
jgi:hypothetical protein